jgi:putative PIN family toxin of toxin-antitoxin system
MRVVLDTNILLSGLMYPGSGPGRIVQAWIEARFELVLSYAQLAEIGRTLAYPKIRKVTRWDQAKVDAFLRQLLLRSELVDTDASPVEVAADPTDTPILAALILSGADVLVSGDKALLALRERFAIVTPAEFAARLA